MKHSEQLNELFSALSKAQGMIKPAEKDNTNPFLKNKYSTLDACWSACREALSANGLSVTQSLVKEEGQLALCSVLAHASGQYITSTMPLLIMKQDPQSLGSALTYAKRYLLCAQVGLTSGDVEDDGEKAMEPHRAPESPKKQSGPTLDEFITYLKSKVDDDNLDFVGEYLSYIENTKKVKKPDIIRMAMQNAAMTDRFIKQWSEWRMS